MERPRPTRRTPNRKLLEVLKAPPWQPRGLTPKATAAAKIAAIVARDFKIWWTYRLWVVLDVSSTLFLVATYFFLAQIIEPDRLVAEGYPSGDYFAFALLGIAFSQYVFHSVQGLSHAIREEQWNGTMDTVASAATRFEFFLLGEFAFLFIHSTIFLSGTLAAGLLLGATFAVSLYAALTATLFALMLLAGHAVIGFMGAGVILKVKMGDPLVWAFTWANQLVAGVFFPLGLLPDFLRWLGFLFPLTYSLDGIRRALMNGETLLTSAAAQFDLLALGVFMAALLPIAWAVFRYGYRSALREGIISQY